MNQSKISRRESTSEALAFEGAANRDELFSRVGSRIAAALAMLALTIIGYRAVGFGVDHASAHTLRLPVDDRIPFWPWTIYLYSWVYTAMLYPLFVVRCPRLFRRTVEVYGLTVVASLATWAVYPVTSIGLRPDVSHLDTSVFHNWGVALTFFVDPPYNLFPSLHLAAAALAMLVAWKARPLFGVCALAILLGVAMSICTMKQHYVLDGVASLVVVAVVYRLRLASYRAEPDAVGPVAYTWRGPALYAAFHGCVWLALYAAFLLGFRPWLG